MATKLWQAFTRRRVDTEDNSKGELARVLGIVDLIALGIGSTLGLGVYVLAASVAKESAGPAVCISFFIAAVASAFAAMCYAEFAARVPKAGSAYAYSYATVGEFIAFVIGWNLVLEYVIGTAITARGLSDYIDALMGNAMRNYLQSTMPINVSFLSKYPDFFAVGMVILMVILLCVGVRESSYLNVGFTVVNLLTIITIIVAGAIKANPKNWDLSPDEIPPADIEAAGSGGFMPFGVSGVMIGAAKCFYGFVGFDGVATTGEEAKNPQRNIPLAIVITLFTAFAAYFSIATVLTMMWPYYAQQAQAPFPFVFEQVGWPEIKWIVNIGAICALFTCLLGAMFPLSRVLYAMGNDGVIFKFLAKIHPKNQTPVIGTVVAGVFIAVMAMIFDIDQLIDMISIGTLLAYTIVAICVLVLRYQKSKYATNDPTSSLYSAKPPAMNYVKQIFNLHNLKEPTNFSSSLARCAILAYTVSVLIFGIILNNLSIEMSSENTLEPKTKNDLIGNDSKPTDKGNSENVEVVKVGYYVGLVLVGLIMLLLVLIIGRQPTQAVQLSFKVPLVPFIPCCSVFINLYLMLQLDPSTWIRFGVWMIIGFSIYFFYGISHSEQGLRNNRALDNEKGKCTESVIITNFQRKCSKRI